MSVTEEGSALELPSADAKDVSPHPTPAANGRLSLASERQVTDSALLAERRRADDALRERDHALALVGHDLANLANVIGLRAQTLARWLRGEVPQQWSKTAEDIFRSSQTLYAWARDLVDLSTVDLGRLRLRFNVEAPGDLLEEGVQPFVALAEERGIALDVDAPPTTTAVHCDRDRILQVLATLLDNALRFSRPRSSVRVRLEDRAGHLVFSVIDSGPGILEEDPQIVFDAFRDSISVGSRRAGLGLFIAKRIVEGHGGRMWVESERGQGAAFYFLLRALPNPPEDVPKAH
jgi:signal transduction histidine kinase